MRNFFWTWLSVAGFAMGALCIVVMIIRIIDAAIRYLGTYYTEKQAENFIAGFICFVLVTLGITLMITTSADD